MDQPSLEQIVQRINAGSADAVTGLREMAAAGNPQALLYLADMTWSGHLVPQDPARGRLLFEYAAALGNPEANVVTTNLIGSGIAGKRDWPACLARLEAEARQLPARRRANELVRAMALDSAGDPRTLPAAEIVSSKPEAIFYRAVLSPAECAYLIDIAQSRFQPSMVYNKERELVRDDIRTSDGAAIHWLIEDPVVHVINRRIAALTKTGYDQGEPLQALRYSPGQQYRAHFDYVEGAAVPRILTALIYLNEEYGGGETSFVRTGMDVRGARGDVLVFRNSGDDGTPDPLSEHAGKPVVSGIKYLATRWIRARRWTV